MECNIKKKYGWLNRQSEKIIIYLGGWVNEVEGAVYSKKKYSLV